MIYPQLNRSYYLLFVVGCALYLALPAHAYAGAIYFQQQTIPPDSIGRDTTRMGPYKPSKFPTGKPTDRFGDPYSNKSTASPLFPAPPTQVQMEIDTGFNYTIYESMGDMPYRPPTTLTFEEYMHLRREQMIRDYWKTQSQGLDGESAVSGRNLIPPIYTSPMLDRIFGGSYVNIRPNGFVNLDFGGDLQRVQNPAIPVRAQRQSQFVFDQQINMNVIGKIGEKLEVAANFDSNNSFDFENNFRVEYTGFPEEIIKKIEIGNVNLPVRNSLMGGAQSLFGVKTQLQFGRLFITGVATTQRGEGDVIELEGGSQSTTFSVRASEYDVNRHFFLGHFFRDNYGIEPGQWLANLPQVTSGINITRMEVYLINRNQQTEGLRDVGAFMDLGEGQPENMFLDQVTGLPFNLDPKGNVPNQNDANGLFNAIRNEPALRDATTFESTLKGWGMESGRDFVLIKSARKLGPTEFEYNDQLGYISLNRPLQTDEALAVAFEYTYNGKRFQVGELTENYQNRKATEVIFLKMLRSNNLNTQLPVWDLMMKNIYALGANQVAREGFQLGIVYRDDQSGLEQPNLQEGSTISAPPYNENLPLRNFPLVRLLGLDQLNQNNDRQPDGNFDFVEGVTINLDRGLIMFPVKEPFGDYLESQINPNQPNIRNKYVFDQLYEDTRYNAELNAEQNKYFIQGKYAASSVQEIALQGINIAPGSVRVFAGNTPLTEGVDYQVDYNFGRVRLLNEGITNSGKKIRITYERASLLNFQTRRFLGTHFDYIVNEDISLGATLLYLNELPLITRVGIGQEPIKNTKWGFDASIRKDSYFLTRALDKLPLLQTKETSTITFNGEFAQMLPGTSNVVNGEGTSYIEDFETAVTPYRIDGNIYEWNLAATPPPFSLTGTSQNQLDYGYKRARLAWYIVDNIFYSDNTRSRYAPGMSKDDVKNNYFRQVIPQELFNRDLRNLQLNEPIFDLAYFPDERGPYNYNPQIQAGGKLPNPESNWGGITRAIPGDVDFQRTNIEYLEFWLMDPFVEGANGRDAAFPDYNIANEANGGRLVFNLGSVSEDYMNDNQHGFENGLPAETIQNPNTPGNSNVTTTPWGLVTNRQYINNAFDLDPAARINQDVGMDGLRNDLEDAYEPFRTSLNQALNNVSGDISGDNFRSYIGAEYPNNRGNILERYKYFNNQEGNTPIQEASQGIVTQGNPKPDNEDLNKDNTINDLEQYYEYAINLKGGMDVGQNFIVDKVTNVNSVNQERVTWYQFRIPIQQYTGTVGNPQGFNTIRYIRTYMTGFKDPVVLRFAKMQFVGSQWRRYEKDLQREGLGLTQEEVDVSNLTISAVSYEDNGGANATTIPYVLPPGFNRDRDNTAQNQQVRLNEQSLQLCIDDLQEGDARAVFKNVTLDLINYGSIKMLFHAHAMDNAMIQDGQVTGFLRLGPDNTQNYYEIEIPLTITPDGAISPTAIWPSENEIDIALNELYALKAERNRLNVSQDTRFMGTAGRHTIYVRGNPQMNDIRAMMIGVRNPEDATDKAPKSVCVWANEMRVANFDRKAGWATNARLNAKLADVANITASTRYSSLGYGDLAQRVNERTRGEDLSYDVSANVALDKFLPERSRLVLPMFLSFEKSINTPYYDPASEDLPLEASLLSLETSAERDFYRRIAQTRSTRRSINFTNIRLTRREGDDTPTPFDLSNLAFSYAYSEIKNSSWEIANYELRTYKAAVAYNYAPKVTPFSPFGASERFNSRWLQWVKDFNISPLPSNVSVRWDLDRRFSRNLYRGDDLRPNFSNLQYEKAFTFNRLYTLRWDLTNSLVFDYNARASAIVDEPFGEIDTENNRQEVLSNLAHFGRMKNFDQIISATYRLPFDKFPLTNWINADARYETNYTWTAGSFTNPDYLDPSIRNNQQDNQQARFGNLIQNIRTTGVTGKVDLVKLYNSSSYLKKINDAGQQSSRPQPARPRPAQPEGEQQPEEKTGEPSKVAKAVLRGLMAVRGITFNATRNEGTMLPGFRPQAFLFGLDSGFVAPGLPFILGSQNPNIRNRAAEEGWLVRSQEITTPFTQTNTVNYDLRADVQPINDMRIQIDIRKEKNANYQEIFRYDSFPDNGSEARFRSLTPARRGSYSISFLSISTAFGDRVGKDGSKAFDKFEANRAQVLQRLQAGQPGAEYQENSQDVLIPAFIAAYSGKDVNDTKLSPFPSIPLPNWRLEYAGLSKVKWLQKHFSSVAITHSYVSRYSVNNYNSQLTYGEAFGGAGFELNNNIEDYTSFSNTLTDELNNGVQLPMYIANQVTISEKFAPLIGVNLRTKTRMTLQMSYNRERNLGLDLSNRQVTELNNQDVRFDIGYTTKDFKVPFRARGRDIILKNDLTMRMGVTIRDTRTMQRRLDEEDDTTNGSLNFQLNPTINYVLNEQLSIQLYFRRSINEPRVLNSYPSSNTAFGIQLRYNITQ